MVDLIRGKYQIVREIARSNDIVYEALDTTLGRRIALKELNIAPGLAGSAKVDRIERFRREARAAGRLSHPNIVSVFEHWEENGRSFIAMEYLEGQNLRDRIAARGPFPLRDALDTAGQILDALAYAHQNRVIHRDIKPDNIHILPGGQVKLTDFGIARLTEEAALTAQGQVFGTPSYMSPEQIEGRHIDFRTDLFSLAVVLYEMLAGRKPFTGDSVISITYNIMHAEPPPLMGVPSGVEQVIRRALAKSPLNRPGTAEEMKRDLRNAEQLGDAFVGRPGYVMPPASAPAGYGPPSLGLSGLPGFATGMPGQAGVPAPMPPMLAPSPAPQGNQPWAWGGAGGQTVMGGAAGVPQLPVQQAQLPGGFAPNAPMNPYAGPPFPVGPRPPLITISPSAKSWLSMLAVAVVLGGVVGGGVLFFLKAYNTSRYEVAYGKAEKLYNQGAAAYEAKDYTKAIEWFRQALDAGPSPAGREKITQSIAFAYVQIAQSAERVGQWPQARQAYEEALRYLPDYAQANSGLSVVLQRMGLSEEAARIRVSGSGSSDVGEAPSSLGQLPTDPDVNSRSWANARTSRQAQARELIQEGDALYKAGDIDGARQKWMQVAGVAPGTPESNEALNRLSQYKSQSSNHNPWDL